MSSSLALIHAQVERRIPGALRSFQRCAGEALNTGIAAIDEYGIRTAALSQICATPEYSSGKTSVMVSLLSHVTAEAFCALIDANDCFDPASAERSGVRLDRLLWVRCARTSKPERGLRLSPLEQAFKAADILLQNGGFRLIAVDLGDVTERALRKVPLTTWFRFARVVEKTETALLFLSAYPAAQSCAGLTLDTRIVEACWFPSDSSHAHLLNVTRHEIAVARQRSKKEPQSVQPVFQATPKWA